MLVVAPAAYAWGKARQRLQCLGPNILLTILTTTTTTKRLSHTHTGAVQGVQSNITPFTGLLVRIEPDAFSLSAGGGVASLGREVVALKVWPLD